MVHLFLNENSQTMKLLKLRRSAFDSCVLVDPGTTQFRIGNPSRGYHYQEDLPPFWLWPEAGSSPQPQTDEKRRHNSAPHHVGLFDGIAIRDFEEAEKFAKSQIKLVAGWSLNLIRPGCLIAVPSLSNHVERRALQDLMEVSGCRRVYFVEAPMAAALGASLDVGNAVPKMIGILGAARSEFAAIAGYQLVSTAGSRNGWNSLLLNCATQSRKRLGEWPERSSFDRALKTYDGENDRLLQEQFSLSNDVLVSEFDAEILRVSASFYSVFDRLRPSDQASVQDNGVTLAGGLVENAFFVKRLSQAVELPLQVARSPRDCVYSGLLKIRELTREGAFDSLS